MTVLSKDGPFVAAICLSLALHASLFLTWPSFDPAPSQAITSTLNLRLSAVSEPLPNVHTEPQVLGRTRRTNEQPQTYTTEVEQPAQDPIPDESEAAATGAPAIARPFKFNDLQRFVQSNGSAMNPTLAPALDTNDTAAQYQRRWHQRVERIGQLNYPDAATQLAFSGQLTLAVAIGTDGTLETVRVVHSTGHKELDLAAVMIVQQASPFEPLPPNLPRTAGLFQFSSTWEFRR